MTEISEMTNEELNNAVAVEVMGWKKYIPPGDEKFAKYVLNDNLELAHYCFSWKPAENNDAAWQVMEKMLKLGWSYVIGDESGIRYCKFINLYITCSTESDTQQRAICEAALNAIRENK